MPAPDPAFEPGLPAEEPEIDPYEAHFHRDPMPVPRSASS